MAAFSLRGYCRTLSERIACTPAITISRLTTMAMTGRRMKRSVKDMALPSCVFRSALRRPRREGGLRRQRVVDDHGHPVAELEGAGAHHRLARLEPLGHGDEVAAPLAQPHELLLDGELLLPGGVLPLLDDVDRVAVGGVEDRGHRD